ncbi:MAG: phosphoribosyltransferase [Deinococcus sp.]|nr:phosphoribosyltransferase [Deinococcus sp.]
MSQVATNLGGEAFRRSVCQHAFAIASTLLQSVRCLNSNPTILVIPRGGICTGVGVRLALQGRQHNYLTVRLGIDDDQLYSLLQSDPTGTASVVLVDGIIGSGFTINQHLETIWRLREAWHGPLGIICNIASQLGIANVLRSPRAAGVPEIFLATGTVVPHDDCRWIILRNGKLAYYVGVRQSIGDFGDMVMQDLNLEQLYNWQFTPEPAQLSLASGPESQGQASPGSAHPSPWSGYAVYDSGERKLRLNLIAGFAKGDPM